MAVLATVGIKGHQKDGKAFNYIFRSGGETPELMDDYVMAANVAHQMELSKVYGDVMPYYDTRQL